MKLSVIIVNYNGGTMVLDAISSVFDTGGNLAVEIIIADNGSTDGSLDAIRKQFGNRITIVEMGKNAGFAARCCGSAQTTAGRGGFRKTAF